MEKTCGRFKVNVFKGKQCANTENVIISCSWKNHILCQPNSNEHKAKKLSLIIGTYIIRKQQVKLQGFLSVLSLFHGCNSAFLNTIAVLPPSCK
jgi:hypothetical protein